MLKALEGNDERIERLVLTKEVYRAAKVNHFEICMEGKMYDIKSVSMQGDTVELLAIHDKDEENILEDIRKLICHSSDKQLPYPKLLNNLLTMYYDQVLFSAIVPDILNLMNTSSSNDNVKLTFTIKNVSTPPPKRVFC